MSPCWEPGGSGAIAALVNVKFENELPFYFADHTPTVVIYTHDMHAPVRRGAEATPSIRHLICMDGPQEGALSLPDLMSADLSAPTDPEDETAIAHLSYTSGTTGKPKGACLAHEPTVRAARCIGERLRIRATDVSFGPSALSSSYQLGRQPPAGTGRRRTHQHHGALDSDDRLGCDRGGGRLAFHRQSNPP